MRDYRTRHVFAQLLREMWQGWRLWFVGPGCGNGIDRVARYSGLVPRVTSGPTLYDTELPDQKFLAAVSAELDALDCHEQVLLRLHETADGFHDYPLRIAPYQIIKKGPRAIELLRQMSSPPIDYQIVRQSFMEIDVPTNGT
jgi:hypothetical protein